MDSLTHLALSGSIAAAIVPPKHRRAAILAGMALGTLPDLDVFLVNAMTSNPILQMTQHRGFSHSLFIMPLVILLLWWLCAKKGQRVPQAPMRWFWAMQLALISHLLLDALTIYGTQLWWPLNVHPTMGATLFIIDPIYTLCLLIPCLMAWFARQKTWSHTAVVLGLALSLSYIGWAFIAKYKVTQAAAATLSTINLAQAPRFSNPLPFNTLLWRVTVMTPEGYLLGDRSVLADSGPIDFQAYPSDHQALAAVSHFPYVQNLLWFNQGFMLAEVKEEQLILSDLRIGLEPEYTFGFIVAERVDGQWQEIPPVQAKDTYRSLVAEGTFTEALSKLWQRIRLQQPGTFNPSKQA
ncbi:MAG: metal-dependent hydrolase [Neisseriaceae bacterium]|nr:metal-dependent hydrolase [Neisseriaceae bacterium]MBP6863251.1 metal-dependent hydrolase [Neisseriaceae bacterium]